MSVGLRRPVGQLDSNYRWDPDSYSDEAFRGEYDANDNMIYKAVARPGTQDGEPEWQISKLTYDANDNLLSVTWPQDANGNPSSNYSFVWSARATYTYS